MREKGDKLLVHLDEEQRRRVAENTGLVAVHLSRHVRLGPAPTREREWDDLFQEGCLGLIEAARSFRPEAGIPFQAYALPRIRTAVSRALRGAFATVRRPLYPCRQRPGQNGGARAPGGTTVTLDFEPADRRPDPRQTLDRPGSGETIGDRLRSRYVQAVQRTAGRLQRTRPARADRAEVVRRIVEQRLLIPEPDARVALRAIARETGSSYARIAECEKRIVDRVRAELADDAETQLLRAEAARRAEGLTAPLEPGLEVLLEGACVDAFVARLKAAPVERQATLLLSLIAAAGASLEDVARRLLGEMTRERRARVLERVA